MVQDLLLVLWFQKEDMEGQGDVMAKGLLFRRHVFLFFRVERDYNFDLEQSVMP